MKKENKALREKVYSFRNAAGVVEAFVMKYARATNFVAKHCGVTPKSFKYSLIKQYMYSNRMWQMTRDTIKYVDRWDLYKTLSPLSVPDFLKYLTSIKSIVIDNWLDTEIS